MERGTTWPQQLRVVVGYADGPKRFRVALDGARAEVKEAVGLPAPLFVLPVGEGWAYGGFELDRASLEYLSRSLPAVTDPLTRGSAWVTLWDALLDGMLAPEAFLDLAAAALPAETDEQLTARILGYAGNAWWRFIPAARADPPRSARSSSCCARGWHGRRRPARRPRGSARCGRRR